MNTDSQINRHTDSDNHTTVSHTQMHTRMHTAPPVRPYLRYVLEQGDYELDRGQR